jgi:lysophospholipase L1-like esterase
MSCTLRVGLAVAVLFVAAGTASSAQSPRSYYLALGDSIAYGFQPTKEHTPPSAVTTGYVDLFAARLRKLAPGIKVVNYGCPGESTVTFVRGGCDWLKGGGRPHDRCQGPRPGAALSFLRAHRGRVSPITLTLWGNDVLPLSEKGSSAPRVIAAFASRFEAIVKQLRAAAPAAEIIVTGAWDPEADRLARTEPLYRKLDAAISRVAAAAHVRTTDMFPALDGTGSFKTQQAQLCRLTFFCSKGDPHPTDAGYRAMAAAFWAASGYGQNP